MQMSGLCPATARTSPSPSSTAATTSWPLSRSSRIIPSRSSARSSAITTRTAVPPARSRLGRYLGVEGRAPPGRADDAQLSVERLDAAPQADEAAAVGVGAAAAVVGDLDDEPARVLGQPHEHLPGAAVLGRVGERLGDDEVGGALDRGGE